MTSLSFLPQFYSLSKTIYGGLIVASSQPTPLNYDMMYTVDAQFLS